MRSYVPDVLSTTMYYEDDEATTTPATAAIPAAAPNYTHTLRVFGSIPYWDQDAAAADFRAHAEAFDFVSFFWYRLDGEGNIQKYRYAKEDPALVTFAQERGVRTFGLIANLPENADWDAERVDAAIGTPEARAEHIADIVALANEKNFDGINIDYEFLRNRQTEIFSTFISELAAALHREGKLLAVAIHAQSPGGPTRGQDLRALQVADILAFMTYDEHWETSEPGPVASLPWVREVITHALSMGIDPKKIYLGLPLYGYDWPDGGNAEGREYDDVLRIANAAGSEVRFDAFAASPVVTYTAGGRARELWFENIDSFSAKYNLAGQYELGGVHLWRLGRQDQRIYEVLE